MPIFLGNNWENHFKDNPTNKDNNKMMDQLIALFAPTVDLDTCLSNSLNEQDTVFTGKTPNANHIIFFRYFTKLGCTRTMPDEKNFILVGTDSTAFPAQASKESCLSLVKFAVPVWISLLYIANPAQVTNLTVRANAAPKKFRRFMSIPPFLTTVLINQGGITIPYLISTAVAKISSFTTEHEEDNYFPSANNHTQPIVNWLWATMKEDFPSPNSALSIDPIIIARSKEIHEVFIHVVIPPDQEPEFNNTEDLNQLATKVSKQTTILQQLKNLAEDRSSKKSKKKGVNTFLTSFKEMILAASSTDSDGPATTPVTTCTEFFYHRSVVHAKIHLIQTLTHVFRCTVKFLCLWRLPSFTEISSGTGPTLPTTSASYSLQSRPPYPQLAPKNPLSSTSKPRKGEDGGTNIWRKYFTKPSRSQRGSRT